MGALIQYYKYELGMYSCFLILRNNYSFLQFLLLPTKCFLFQTSGKSYGKLLVNFSHDNDLNVCYTLP